MWIFNWTLLRLLLFLAYIFCFFKVAYFFKYSNNFILNFTSYLEEVISYLLLEHYSFIALSLENVIIVDLFEYIIISVL